MSSRRVLLVLAGFLAILSPSAANSCVIVNVNGVMDPAIARACLRESYRKPRTFPFTEKWPAESESKGTIPEEKANEVVNTPHEPTRIYQPKNKNSKALRDPYARQMVCMFVSGFSLAAGLLLFLSWMTLGEKKPRPPVFRAMPAVASSPSCSSSDHDHRRPASERAEAGSSSPENLPFRAQLRPPELARPPVQSTPSTKVCEARAGTVQTSTPNSSAVALSTREYWL